MLKNAFCLFIVSLGLVAAAQDFPAAASKHSDVSADVPAEPDVLPPAPPPYCNPCIFYSGDFDPKKDPNGLLNGLFPGAVDGKVWVPFAVQNKVLIQGLFVNELFASPPPTPVPAKWVIRAGVSNGNGGKVQCSGTGNAKAKPTGRTFTFGGTTYTEWTYRLVLPQSQYCQLKNPASRPGQLVLPPGKGQCPPNCYMLITTDNSGAEAAPSTNFGYLSDVPAAPHHHFGLPNVVDNSFFSSTSFGFNFVPAMSACAVGPPLSITQVGCHMFSVGLIGTGK